MTLDDKRITALDRFEQWKRENRPIVIKPGTGRVDRSPGYVRQSYHPSLISRFPGRRPGEDHSDGLKRRDISAWGRRLLDLMRGEKR